LLLSCSIVLFGLTTTRLNKTTTTTTTTRCRPGGALPSFRQYSPQYPIIPETLLQQCLPLPEMTGLFVDRFDSTAAIILGTVGGDVT